MGVTILKHFCTNLKTFFQYVECSVGGSFPICLKNNPDWFKRSHFKVFCAQFTIVLSDYSIFQQNKSTGTSKTHIFSQKQNKYQNFVTLSKIWKGTFIKLNGYRNFKVYLSQEVGTRISFSAKYLEK